MSRRLGLGCAAMLAAALGLAGVTAPAAQADAAITSQWYTGPSGIDELRAQGLDGSGVTIAVIDGKADPNAPELRGIDYTVKDFCNEPQDADDQTHANNVIAILANQHYGWAPKAKIINYVSPTKPEAKINKQCRQSRAHRLSFLVHKAIDDGADIITIQQGGETGIAYATARASQHGIPVVASAGNTGLERNSTSSHNGIVSVGANDQQGKRAAFSSWSAGLTIMAPGTGIKVRTAAGAVTEEHGTSYSTPMVSGALALAKQRWPKATGNQLIESLIKTAQGTGRWEQQTGWGSLDAKALVAADPAGYPDKNPLEAKNPGVFPSAKEIQDYHDGLLEFSAVGDDPEYVYRGKDQIMCNSRPERCELGTSPRFRTPSPTPATSPSPSASGTASPAPADGSASSVPIVVGAIVVLLAAAGAWFIARRRGSSPPR